MVVLPKLPAIPIFTALCFLSFALASAIMNASIGFCSQLRTTINRKSVYGMMNGASTKPNIAASIPGIPVAYATYADVTKLQRKDTQANADKSTALVV